MMKKLSLVLLILSAGLIAYLLVTRVQAPKTRLAKLVNSVDGNTVSYQTDGTGPALLFVHGWSCDSRYWINQVVSFSKAYQVIRLDLGGHSYSGHHRKNYTVSLFAEDVKAVVDDLKLEKVIHIGHSFGGAIIAEAGNRSYRY